MRAAEGRAHAPNGLKSYHPHTLSFAHALTFFFSTFPPGGVTVFWAWGWGVVLGTCCTGYEALRQRYSYSDGARRTGLLLASRVRSAAIGGTMGAGDRRLFCTGHTLGNTHWARGMFADSRYSYLLPGNA